MSENKETRLRCTSELKNSVKDLNEESRTRLIEAAGDEGEYRSLLQTIARFPSYSVMNAARINARAPEATMLKDEEGWNQEHTAVKVEERENGIPIVKPQKSAEGKTYFKAEYLFDIAQTQTGGKAVPCYTESILERAFEKAEAPSPVSAEGRFIVGQHFGLPSELEGGQLPPAGLFAVDDLAEAAYNVRNYLDDIRRAANDFIRAVSTEYTKLVVENVQSKNAELFHAYARAGQREAQSVQPESDFDARLDAAEHEALEKNAPQTDRKEAEKESHMVL